jgi:dihydropyrimidinase
MSEFDLVVRNGTVVTAADAFRCDIGVRDGRIEALARRLGPGRAEIDATDRLVLPGGVDSHVHIEQDSPETGAVSAGDFRSATASAACGGTTTVIPFVRQVKGQSLRAAVEDYHARAGDKPVIDYAFHLIVTDPTPQVLGQELPALVRDGYTSVKVYMTYEAMRLADRQILDVLAFARAEGVQVMVHAENADAIAWLTRRLLDSGRTEPRWKRVAHAAPGEAEAAQRAIRLAEIVNVPILIVHVATAAAADEIARAQAAGLEVYGETCPQYLFLDERDIDRPGIEGAKCICAPPPGTPENQAGLWRALERGVFQVFSSDHAAFRFDDPKGKLVHGPNPPFHRITNGLPGMETRLPLLYSGAVQTGRIDVHRFVALTATNPARIYGLYPRKGTIAIGADADLAVWDPEREVTIRVDLLHDEMDYSPYEGRAVRGWPVVTIARGEVVCRDFEFVGTPGRGRFLPCDIPNPPRDDDFLLRI